MTLDDLSDRAAVLAAVAEFDRLGRTGFLRKHRFGVARRYFLEIDGRWYDSKAIVGVAHGYQFPGHPLGPDDFSGGEATVVPKLRSLGFKIVEQTTSPPWTRDELILALDLYLRRGLLDDTDTEVAALSDLLRRLPLHPGLHGPSFRNPNGVAMKLANLAALDPSYSGGGLPRGGRADGVVFEEFAGRPDDLARLAAAIREAVAAETPLPPGEPDDEEEGVLEGRLLFRQHRSRERSRKLAAKKKAVVLAAEGRLTCEACGLDPATRYGDIGDAVMECHHRRGCPVARRT